MNEILEFIQRYFYWVIIILFFLFRTMRGGKTNKPGMPTFGGQGEQQGHPAERPAERPAQHAEPRAEQPRPALNQGRQQEPRTNLAPKYEAARESMQQRASVSQAYSPSLYDWQSSDGREFGNSVSSRDRSSGTSMGSSAAARRRSLQSAMLAGVSKNELRKAVLWAEVLGEPRAKRPFRK